MSTSARTTSTRARGALLIAALGAVALTGCGAAPAPAAAQAAPAAAQPAVVVSDPWVKAVDSGMTAVFGTFSTPGSTPVTVVSAVTTASPRTELHEVATGDDGAMVMRPKEGGFTIEPGAPHSLAPGGDHIMIMDLASPIRPGDDVDVTLTLEDGSTVGFSALAKETTAGEENYEHGEGAMSDTSGAMTGMSGMPGAPAGQGG
jgi:copper(I)-binding protein